jgi:hypothetical protein
MDAKTQITETGPGKETARRAAPRGLSRLSTYATGKEILILGPSSAGKTKFAQYLRLGMLDQEGSREMTYQITKSPVFVIRLGSGAGLQLKVRRAVDTPGQVGPIQHATLVGRRKPHAIIVMLDCTKAVSTSVRWLRLFCDRLDTVLRKGTYAQNKLSGVLVLLNKRDKVNSNKSGEIAEAVQEVLGRYLSVVLGADRAQAIPILDCISVRTAQGTALIDEVINQLAQRLKA